jgi:hypothetical protein
MGIVYPILVLVIGGRVLVTGLAAFRGMPNRRDRGSLLGALGAHTGVLITSITEIGTNTFFFPMSAACVMILSARAKSDLGARQTFIASENDPSRAPAR